MKMKQSLLFVSMLLILVIAAGACIENTDESSGDPSDSFVHPGIGFHADVVSNPLVIDTYGIVPASEMRTNVWNDTLEEIEDDVLMTDLEYGLIAVGFDPDENVNESQMNEVYSLYYQKGLEKGIDDVPIVFYYSDSGLL